MWKNCGFVESKKKVNKSKLYKNTKIKKNYKIYKPIHKGCKHVDKLIYKRVYKRG